MHQLSDSIRDPRTAQALCRELFARQVAASALPSYADINFRVHEVATGGQFVLKLANPAIERADLELENAAMRHLAAAERMLATPAPIAAANGDDIIPVRDPDGTIWHARLVTWVEGRLWSALAPATDERLHALGRALGELGAALAELEHPHMHRHVDWDLRHAPAAREHLPLIENDALRATLQEILDHFDSLIPAQLDALPRALIHNDANDNNLLLDSECDDLPVGLVDFGDMAYTWRIADLAVAAAYVCAGRADPMLGICAMVAGYHEVNPLQADELAVLRDLILARLAQSLCHSAAAKRREPDNAYIPISEQSVQQLLHTLQAETAAFTHYRLRAACGMEGVPQGDDVRRWLRAHQPDMAGVLDADLRTCRKLVYDFSATAAEPPALEGDTDTETAKMFAAMAETGAAVAVGRYREDRRCYQGDQFAAQQQIEARTVHMGIDLFVPAGEPIYAPVDGIVHDFADNALPYDYGPTIILRHEPEPGIRFFTLYGHLARESLQGLATGTAVRAGERLGWIGTAAVNGGWIPHLHFQIMLDMFDLQGDFPAVCRLSQTEVWESICPDPNLILGMPESVKARVPWSPRAIRNKRRRRLSAALSSAYERPLKITGGRGTRLFDHTGRAYLDMVNNVCHVGHCHPRVVAAAQQQMAQLNTNSRYLHDHLVDYAERLTDLLPPQLSVVFFVNSGSEANDLALRLARTHTDRRDIGVIDHAYHGHLGALIDISPYKHDGAGGRGTPPFVHKCPFPDPYRGPFKGDDPWCGRHYAQQAKRVLARGHERDGGGGVAAFIAESFSGVGGQVIWPDDYLREVFAYVRKLGGVCITDEVQVGFGRAGDAFWGFETQHVEPDIVTLGKPIGNGHPLAAVVTTADIAASFATGMEYFNTFGGNPVSCAVGLAVLDVVQDERLQDNARDVGAYLQAGLHDLRERHALIGDVRGRGLFMGVELVRDHATLEPATAQANAVCARLRAQDVLLTTDGPLDNVLKIKPPIVFSHSDADLFLQRLDNALRAVGNA